MKKFLAFVILAGIFFISIFVNFLEAAPNSTNQPAEDAIKAWAFNRDPGMDPSTRFPVEEVAGDPDIRDKLEAGVFTVTAGPLKDSSFLVQKEQAFLLASRGIPAQYPLVVDLNHDGIWDMVYAYSWGKGFVRSRAGIYSEVLDSPDRSLQGSFIFLDQIQIIKREGKACVDALSWREDDWDSASEIGTLEFQSGKNPSLSLSVTEPLAKEFRFKLLPVLGE